MHRSLIIPRARNLMTLHGLGPRWKIEIKEWRGKIGQEQTIYWSENPALSSGVLRFSAPAFELMSDEDCDNAILHEIAHALCPTEFDDKGRLIAHGERWKRTARRIGCDANRTISVPGLRPPKKLNWKATCSEGHTYYRTRLTESVRTNSACNICVTKYKIPSGMREGLVWVRNTDQPVVRSTPVPKPQNKPRPVLAGEAAWKDRFDQGSTSFDDIW